MAGSKRWRNAKIEVGQTLNLKSPDGMITLDFVESAGPGYIAIPSGYYLERDGASSLYILRKDR